MTTGEEEEEEEASTSSQKTPLPSKPRRRTENRKRFFVVQRILKPTATKGKVSFQLSFLLLSYSEREGDKIIITILRGIFFRNTYTCAAGYKDVEKLPKCLGDKFSSLYRYSISSSCSFSRFYLFTRFRRRCQKSKRAHGFQSFPPLPSFRFFSSNHRLFFFPLNSPQHTLTHTHDRTNEAAGEAKLATPKRKRGKKEEEEGGKDLCD